jgi:kynurenine formamidase
MRRVHRLAPDRGCPGVGGARTLAPFVDLVGAIRIAPGRFTLAALPVKLMGSEAAPARAVLLEGVA